jgi:2-polyprenyl-6-methoxyphenol hydroxylase-like FAD-dependent oxidoreductase
LASFDVADRWVDHPYCNGVVLVGDSAAASDPSFGCGLSLTFRDVRVLRDHLVANDDWDAAADAYAVEHDRYFGSLHRILSWYRELNYADGSEADTRRARVRPLLYEQPQRRPDFVAFGPEAPSDEPARQRFFGEA